MVDEMRWDAMHCVGHPVVDTPNLDRLAKQGMRFENSYTVAPVCSPARTAVFTGRYAQVAGVTTNAVPANNGEIFLYSRPCALASCLSYSSVLRCIPWLGKS